MQARKGQAWNPVWVGHVRLQSQLRQQQATRWAEMLHALEQLRSKAWRDLGDAAAHKLTPPLAVLQLNAEALMNNSSHVLVSLTQDEQGGLHLSVSSMGLANVERAAAQHGAKLALEDGPGGRACA